MAKSRTKKNSRRPIDQQIADLEAKLAKLRVVAKDRERFSPDAVKKERDRLGLTAAEYGELVGVAMITIFAWEHGRTRPRAAQLERWLAVKGMPRDVAWKKLGIQEAHEFSGKAVLAERKRLGLSAKKYGDLIGVSMLTVYNWEKGVSLPRGDGLEKWLAVRGIARGKAERQLGIG